MKAGGKLAPAQNCSLSSVPKRVQKAGTIMPKAVMAGAANQ